MGLAVGMRVKWSERGWIVMRRGTVQRVTKASAWVRTDRGSDIRGPHKQFLPLSQFELDHEAWERTKPKTEHVDAYVDLCDLVYRFRDVRGPVSALPTIEAEVRALREWLDRRPSDGSEES